MARTNVRERFTTWHLAIAGLLAAGATMLAMNRNVADGVEDRITPAVEVINFGAIGLGVGRFDTATGAIMTYNGDLRHPSGVGEWVRDVDGVGVAASGTYRLMQAGTAHFLVDAAAGRTWLLRQRSSNWRWEEVKTSNAR